jgi:2,3-bisphosphoglycerate-independent phosphoglycerate mutase
MKNSRDVLLNHEINKVRIDLKENPANMIWLWGQGRKIKLPSFKEKFGISGCVISAVDLVKGIALLIGLKPLEVPGVTGYYDTNYSGKAEYALNSLKDNDFVYVHLEATDEAGHNGDLRSKIGCIERFDELIVGKILKEFKNRDDFRILVVPDHATPVKVRTHTRDVVCFTMMGKNIPAGQFQSFSEKEALKSSSYFEQGYKLMEDFIKL